MEATWRWIPVTAIAPVAWGSSYYVTREFLPAGQPVWGALLRALPAGLILLALRHRRPRGVWWGRAAVLGVLNVGAFFVLVYRAATLLPASVASTVMALAPVVMMGFGRLLLGRRPRAFRLAAAGVGVVGVAAMVLTGREAVAPGGLVASAAALGLSSLGYVLAQRWDDGPDVLTVASWQLVAGSVVLVPVALLREGRPPALDGAALAGFGYLTLVATALAFAAWFTALRHLDAGTVGIVGLLNPVTGVLLGTALGGEALSGRQWGGVALVLGGVAAMVVAGGPGSGPSRAAAVARRPVRVASATPASPVHDRTAPM